MARGGARVNSGPPPDPNALRNGLPDGKRTVPAGWLALPADGYPHQAPEWPLPTLSGRERELWEREWRRPQAFEWIRQGQELEVALYVRRFAEAETPGSTAALSTLVRQMQDSLGITLTGMRAHRWMIVQPPAVTLVPPPKAPARSGKRTTGRASERLKVIRGDQASR